MEAGVTVDVDEVPSVPACIISSKCALNLKTKFCSYHYYFSIGRDRSPVNMNYNSVLCNFNFYYEALAKLSKHDKPDVPVV